MLLFPTLNLLDPDVQPGTTKVHLAVHNRREDPLDLFFAGTFDPWQATQTKRNFQRPHVLALISLPERNRWLFAGLYDSSRDPKLKGRIYHYELRPRPLAEELNGRVVVAFERTGRASYLNAETWADQFEVVEIRSERMSIADFPGFLKFSLTYSELQLIVRQQLKSWRSALSSVGGVYLISDTETGKLYVGSATGEIGIWGRWCAYAKNGHGGNRELREVLDENGPDYVQRFVFAILETADSSTGPDEILAREAHWKRVLLTREHGYNKN